MYWKKKNTFAQYTHKYMSVVQIASEKASGRLDFCLGMKAAKCPIKPSGVCCVLSVFPNMFPELLV